MAIFDENNVYIVKSGEVILHGHKDPITRLYMVNITNNTTTIKPKLNIKHLENLGGVHNHTNNAYDITKKRDLIEYYHKCCFSPVISTWVQAIKKGNFCTWPGLTSSAVIKYLPPSLATAKGHMQQQHKNIRSTKPKEVDTMSRNKDKSEEGYFEVLPIATTGKTFSDQTGRFPVTSSRGNKYIMIFYDYDSNSILGEPLKSRSAEELVRAFSKIHTNLKEKGSDPPSIALTMNALHH